MDYCNYGGHLPQVDYSGDERNTLYDMMQEEDSESGYRARIILLKDEWYAVPEIRMATNNRHDINIRKWIHRFNEKGIDGIASKIHKHRPNKISDDMENKIVEIATKNPRLLWITVFNMVFTGTGRIHIQGDKPC